MLSKIKHNEYFIKLFQGIGGVVNHILPKKKRIVLYSNWGFRDNVRYLYDYLIDHSYNEKYQIVCASNDFYDLDRTVPRNVVFTRSKIDTLRYFLTSNYFFYCFGGIPIKSVKNQTIVNLWHGMPIKKIGRLESGMSRDINYFDYLVSYSDFFSPVLKESFDVDQDKIIIANAPRNEVFISQSGSTSNKDKVIAWLPTYRKSSKLDSQNGESDEIIPLFNDLDDFRKFDQFLKSVGIRMFVKLHPLQDRINIPKNLTNMIFIDDSWLFEQHTDLYTFLAETDALITDYSSVSIDYLLLNRPIFYVMNDQQAYANTRGFNYTLDQFIAGQVVQNMDQFRYVLSSFSKDQDGFAKLRREKINTFYSGSSAGIKEMLGLVGI